MTMDAIGVVHTHDKAKRESGLELYRIILMLGIVAHHYVVNSGVLAELLSSPLSLKSLSFLWFGMWGKTGINAFVLITGYFMCTSQITFRKFLKLILEIMFYGVAVFAIFLFFGYEQFSWFRLFQALNPVKGVGAGFTSCFVLFYLLIPFLNILVRNMTRRQHQLLVELCLFIFTVLGSIPFINVTMNYVEWFCVLYFIASYLRLYGLPVKLSAKQLGAVFLLTVMLSMLSVWGIASRKVSWECYYFVSECNQLGSVVVSVAMFMTFKTLNLHYNRWINTAAQSVFGVLLIHANSDAMRQWLWNDIVDTVYQYHQDYALLWAFLTVVVIFVACIIIDQLRIHVIETPLFRWLDNKYSLNRNYAR